MDDLSRKAREEYDRLQREAQAVIEADKQREPKLTEEEAAEILTLNATIKKNGPINERLLKQIIAKSERLKFLERNSQKLVSEGEDVDKVVSELVLLPQALELLEATRRAANMETTVSVNRIERIKATARVREIREEAAENGQ